MVDYPAFADFAEETKSFEGDKKKIEDILNQNVLIIDFKVKSSNHKKGSLYATIQFKIDEITYIVFTGSGVLISQLEKYKDNLPFHTKIKKIDRYYTFT